MLRILGLFAFLLGIGLVVGYGLLGGFREAAVKVETTKHPVYLAGQYYRGSVQSEAFGQLFQQAKAAQDKGTVPGATALANLYFNNPTAAQDSIHALIGLAVRDTLHPLPTGWHYRLVPAGQRVVAARLDQVNPMLAPGKLYPGAQAAARQLRLRPRPFYFEQFGPGEAAQVWLGVE